MPDVIVIGGGLSGLAAAWTLEKHHIPYTLIEVKRRLGGAIASEARMGFIVDHGPFVLDQTQPWPWLAELGLTDAVADAGPGQVIFRQGTQVLVDALADRLTHGVVMQRMSVSTLGQVEGQYAVCLENGMLLPASALIVTAPARYAERMFYTFVPEISRYLLEFHYDEIVRVSLGYVSDMLPDTFPLPADFAFSFCYRTTCPERVKPGHTLLQIGLRLTQAQPFDDTAILRGLCQAIGLPETPAVALVTHWPEAHALSVHDVQHAARMQTIRQLLPPGVALAGSDYDGLTVEARMQAGIQAAERIIAQMRR